MRRLLLVPLLALLGGCPSGDPCANVVCKAGKICDPGSGACVPGGDAGTVDAGQGDGGAPDSGTFDAGTDCVDDCFANFQVCDFSTGHCVDCLSNFDCYCPYPVCINKTCIAGDSDAGVTPPIPGEGCSTAADLNYPVCDVPRQLTIEGVNLAATQDDEQGSCSNSSGGGRDVVYHLFLDDFYDLTITVTPRDAMVQPVVYLREDFCVGGQELACKAGMTSGPVSFTVKGRIPGDYYLVLDTFDSASGGLVDLTVRFDAPTFPGNETCATAEPLLTDAGVTSVDLSTANNDDFTVCNPGGGPDVFYSVHLDQTSDLLVTAVGEDDPDAGIAPVLEVRNLDCQTEQRLKCRPSYNFGPATVRLRSAAAGDYLVVLETSGAAGWVDVTASALPPSQPPANESCLAPSDIAFPPDGGFTAAFDVDTSDGKDDERGACSLGADGGSPEYVYRLRLLSPRNVVVKAVADPLVQPVLYLRSGTCEGLSEQCVSDAGVGSSEVLDAGPLVPGDYWLFVESTSSNSGVVHVTVSATP